jgi:uncharacterized protein (TIGR03118 family)
LLPGQAARRLWRPLHQERFIGRAIGNNGSDLLYATNFSAGEVDVFNSSFAPVSQPAGAFTDPNLPNGYAPFGVQNIGGQIFVTYAMQDAA